MNQKVKEHFRSSDSLLYQALEKIGELEVMTKRIPEEYFLSLCGEIIAQQLNGTVAEVIFKRFEKLFVKGKITPEGVLKLSDKQLRSTGMSNSKVGFLKDLAEKVSSGKLNLQKLKKLPDAQVIRELVKVKGIGPWTAEMFLIFCLGREDVFSYGDLGLKNALKKLYKLENPTKEELEKIVVKWSPYRSYACRILWKILDK